MQSRILDHLSTAVVILDHKFRVLALNPAAEGLLDTSAKRVVTQLISSVIPQTCLLTDLHRAFEQSQQLSRRETDLLINGATVPVDYTISPITPDQLLLELTPRDRVQRITREGTLIAQQETSRILVRALAHEIKNPLGGIRGAAQLLARELVDNGLQEYTDVIIQEADRLRDLVDQMLGPHQPPQMAAVNIHEVLARVIQLIDAETGGELTIQQDYDPSIPDIPGDVQRLQQAILNLVRNAMQAIVQVMPLCAGLITLRTRVVRQFTIGTQPHRLVCQLSVIDNGPGIAPDLLDSIFYPMISTRPDGTGLGLSIAQSIIALHQGLIECRSQPGATVFDVFLPLQQHTTE